MRVVQSSTTYFQNDNNWVCPKKKWPISLAGGSSEPSQGSWAYLGPLGITPRAVAQFQGAWEARKKEFFSDFGLYPLVHREFPKTEMAKVLFHLLPPKIYCSCFVESNKCS